MTFCFVSPLHKQTWLRPARLAVASLVAVITADDQAGAAKGRNERAAASFESRVAGEPVEPTMAIVSLRNQRITVYDAKGWILRAPVSSGQKGRETPAGIFSVIQKEAEHYSNLYDDAYMPHMQRITWSGIALHGGVLPGYAASHGCVRMPYDFAARLFDATKLGMRVIVAPGDAEPVEVIHPALFQPKSGADVVAAARAAEADEAARKADQARLAAVTASREAARAMVPVRAAENLKLRAEAQLATADRAVASAGSEAKEQAEDAKAKAAARVTELEAQWAATKAELQPKLDAVAAVREAAVAAENARVAAAEAARKAARDLEPMSVFISRKTQRLYVRQGFQPILESPVTIQDADRPIGTHVFTAIERAGNDVDTRWSVVSLNGRHADAGADERHPAPARRGQGVEPMVTDPGAGKAALDRIAIPQDVLDRIAEIASPRSSLIISDEALSSEAGKDPEFVVLMSGEPQGGIKFRHRRPETKVRYGRASERLPPLVSPFAGQHSTW